MDDMSGSEQREDTIPQLPTITEGRLVVPYGFKFTEEEVNESSTKLLQLADTCSSHDLQAPEEIHNALRLYKDDDHFQVAVNKAASDAKIVRALFGNEDVNNFLSTSVRQATDRFTKFLGSINDKVRIGPPSDAGSSKARSPSVRSPSDAGSSQAISPSDRSVTEKYTLAKDSFIELLKSIWNFLRGEAGKVLESVGSTFNRLGGNMKERLQNLLILLLGIFKHNLEGRVYRSLSYEQ